MKADKDKYSKTTIVHLKHVFYGKYIYVFGCLGVPWGVVECHGVISSTGPQVFILIASILSDTHQWSYRLLSDTFEL